MTGVTAYHSTHLKQLEVESIQIISEVATEFEWLASKASTVMLQLARKEFFPGKPPFSLLHVDTTCKFREMLEFRDRYIRELVLKLIVHTNGRGEERR
jgi:sulfate adenylyltransferase subunit 2